MSETEQTQLAETLLDQPFEELSIREQRVIESMVSGAPVAENVNQVYAGQTSVGARLADRLAKIVGSWGFIISFIIFLVAWMVLNTYILSRADDEFDPYPYILLNLLLSTMASLQAPVIMMSQNRQSEKGRISAANAFEVSLKTELSIEQLHKKVDTLLTTEPDRHV